MNILIGSLTFSPVFTSHCLALGNQCEIAGHKVFYLFDNKYRWMLPDSIGEKCLFFENTFSGTSLSYPLLLWEFLKTKNRMIIKEYIKRSKITHVYMFNYHSLNHEIASYAKKHNIIYIQHIHEVTTDPSNKFLYYGYLLKYSYEFMISLLLMNTDIVVLSSDLSYKLFKQKYPQYSGNIKLIPLIYQDMNFNITRLPRKYITFMGPPIPSKNVSLFYDLVKYTIANKLSYNFLLISRNEVTVNAELLTNLEIIHKRQISDEEVGNLLSQSIASIIPYKNCSQSSNVNTSYKYGTPVIASDIPGLRQFVLQGKTGCLVDLEAPLKEWVDAIQFISDNFKELSRNCNRYYDEQFSEHNWSKYLPLLFSCRDNSFI